MLAQGLKETQRFMKIPPWGHVTAMAKALKDGYVPSQGAQREDLLPLGIYYFLVQVVRLTNQPAWLVFKLDPLKLSTSSPEQSVF